MTTRAATESTSPLNEIELAMTSDASFRAWYDRVLPRVYAYLASRCGEAGVAEELTQETFHAAIQQRARFDGRADVVTWMCAIARHKLADHFRHEERTERRADRLRVREIEVAPPDPTARVDEREAIRTALSSLPVAQRAVLILVNLDGLPVRDAARLLGKSESATQSLLFRAREAFKAAYGREATDA